MQSTVTTGSFWEFSLAYYSQADHQRILLCLQDEFDLNVNLILALLYFESINLPISLEQYHALRVAIEPVNKTTKHIRSQRRAIKIKEQGCDKDDQRYQSLLAKELESEKNEQATIIKHYQIIQSAPPTEESTNMHARTTLHQLVEQSHSRYTRFESLICCL